MGVSAQPIRKYIDLLKQTFVVRVLPPFAENIKKILIKSPKVYIRDSGILHALLDLETMEDLFSSPMYGASYEGYVIENIITQAPRWQSAFYRTSNSAEIDLVLSKGNRKIAIEIKSSTSPKVSKGFWSAIETIKPVQSYVVAPVDQPYPIAGNLTVISMPVLIERLTKYK